MMASLSTKLLAVRLPEAEKRRMKSVAASQGLSLQEAVHQAMEAWASRLQAEGALPLAPPPQATADLRKPRRQERAAKRS